MVRLPIETTYLSLMRPISVKSITVRHYRQVPRANLEIKVTEEDIRLAEEVQEHRRALQRAMALGIVPDTVVVGHESYKPISVALLERTSNPKLNAAIRQSRTMQLADLYEVCSPQIQEITQTLYKGMLIARYDLDGQLH